MVDCLWLMFSSFVVSSSVTPQCLTSLGRLAHHLVDVKQRNGPNDVYSSENQDGTQKWRFCADDSSSQRGDFQVNQPSVFGGYKTGGEETNAMQD